MTAVNVPALLDAILEATATEAGAKARIASLRATLEDEARRRYAADGAAPSWNTPKLGKVRLDPPGDWTPVVSDPAAFSSHVAERFPTEVTTALTITATDLTAALDALEFAGIGVTDTRVEVRPAFRSTYLEGLAVDVTETRDDDTGAATRDAVFADTTTGDLIPGLTVTRREARLTVSLDRDRRTAAIDAATDAAGAVIAAATGDTTEDATADLVVLDVRRRELETLRTEQLAAVAKAHGLGSSGTKAALAERVARAEQATGHVIRPATPYAEPAGIVARTDGTTEPIPADPARALAAMPAPGPIERGSVPYLLVRRTDEIVEGRSREVLRAVAKRHGLPSSGTKREVAEALAAHGITAADLDHTTTPTTEETATA